MSASTASEREARRRRSAPLLWGSGLLAAAILILGVNGTLSTWTSAVINNSTNTVAAASAVVLQETNGTATCNSTDTGDGSNTYTCSTINKYGGTATPLAPGTSQSVSVTMKNTGTGSGTLTLAPSACSKSAGSPTATQSICDTATVAVSCTAPSALNMPATVLSAFTTTQTVGTLAGGASTTCTFTVTVPSNASPQIAGQIASQPLLWTLQ